MVKPGGIIGLTIGAVLFIAPIMAFANGEASLSDSTNRTIALVACMIGFFMVIANIIELVKKPEQEIQTHARISASKNSLKASSDSSPESKIRCRFCKKLYDSEFNGCPYCKKK